MRAVKAYLGFGVFLLMGLCVWISLMVSKNLRPEQGECRAMRINSTAMLRGSMRINADHHLEIGGVDVVALMQKSRYPIYVMDEQLIRDTMRAYVKGIHQHYPNPGFVFYATKALMTRTLCTIAQQEGLGLDVSTEGELYIALQAHFPMQRVILHGNNKSEEEITLALQSGVGRIVVDNLDDIHLLEAIAKKLHKTAHVLIRVKPGIDAHTHHHIATANKAVSHP